MAGLPNWLQPTDVLSSISAGTNAGLRLRQIGDEEDQQQANNQLRGQQIAAATALRQGQMSAMQNYRQQQIDDAKQKISDTEAKNKAADTLRGLVEQDTPQFLTDVPKIGAAAALKKYPHADKQTVYKELAAENQESRTPGPIKMLNEVDSETKAAADAKAAGDDAASALHTKRAQTIQTMLPTHGEEEVSTGFDDQGRPIFKLTKGGGLSKSGSGSTVATESAAQQKDIQFENAIELANRLQNNLQGRDVGVAGVAGEMLGDKLGPQVPGLGGSFSKERVGNRVDIGTFRESVMRIIGDNPRYSNKDREEISALLPNTGMAESLPDAQARIAKVRDILTDRARVYSERTGTPTPWGAKSKDQIISDFKKQSSAIQKAIQLKNISQEDGLKEIADARKQAEDALVRFH